MLSDWFIQTITVAVQDIKYQTKVYEGELKV